MGTPLFECSPWPHRQSAHLRSNRWTVGARGRSGSSASDGRLSTNARNHRPVPVDHLCLMRLHSLSAPLLHRRLPGVDNACRNAGEFLDYRQPTIGDVCRRVAPFMRNHDSSRRFARCPSHVYFGTVANCNTAVRRAVESAGPIAAAVPPFGPRSAPTRE